MHTKLEFRSQFVYILFNKVLHGLQIENIFVRYTYIIKTIYFFFFIAVKTATPSLYKIEGTAQKAVPSGFYFPGENSQKTFSAKQFDFPLKYDIISCLTIKRHHIIRQR